MLIHMIRIVRRDYGDGMVRFSTLMERAEVMTALRSGGHPEFPQSFEDRVPENAKKVQYYDAITRAWYSYPSKQKQQSNYMRL